MELLQRHRAETVSIAMAVVVIGVGTAYYFYITNKTKQKGLFFFFFFFFFFQSSILPFLCFICQSKFSFFKLSGIYLDSFETISFRWTDWILPVALTVLMMGFKQIAMCCLDPDKFKEFKLVKRTQLSHNVAKFKFALPTPSAVLGLPIGQHMSCRFGSFLFL
ncbi:hypothetical protein ACFX15_006691 [Malus domestica]